MPYPYAITASFAEGSDAGKVIVRGTALYKWLSMTSTALGMWKSTDDGVTWAEMDSANRPAYDAANAVPFEFDDGTDIWLTAAATGAATYANRFDTATDTWDTPISVTNAAQRSAGTWLYSQKQAMVVKRPNGELVYIYSHVFTGSMASQVSGLRYQVSTDDGATWSTAADLMLELQHEPDAAPASYYLTGACVASDGRVIVTAAMATGVEGNGTLTHVTIKADDTVGDYESLGWDTGQMNNTGPRYGTTWGKTMLVEHCGDEYAALPWAPYNDKDQDETYHQPAVILIPANGASMPASSVHRQREMFYHAGNWRSVSITGDATYLMLVWADIDWAGSADATIRCSCWAGRYWTAPETLFSTVYATHGAPETLEATYSDGVMRVHFWGQNSSDNFYWQGAYTPAAQACGGEGGAFYGAA